MPTYGYVCKEHGPFDVFKSITKCDVPEKCPKCGKEGKKQISAGGGVIFKGPGFYCNDYPKKPK